MKVTPLSIPDVLLIEPSVFEDSRGFFFESFREDVFKKETSLDISFVQDNHSKSSKAARGRARSAANTIKKLAAEFKKTSTAEDKAA